MRFNYFESFVRMIEGLPVRAVLRAARIEQRMLEDDVVYHRGPLTAEERSVLNFCRFLDTVENGSGGAASAIGFEHVVFYRNTVEKLVTAGELPSTAKKRFADAYSEVFLKVIAA